MSEWVTSSAARGLWSIGPMRVPDWLIGMLPFLPWVQRIRLPGATGSAPRQGQGVGLRQWASWGGAIGSDALDVLALTRISEWGLVPYAGLALDVAKGDDYSWKGFANVALRTPLQLGAKAVKAKKAILTVPILHVRLFGSERQQHELKQAEKYLYTDVDDILDAWRSPDAKNMLKLIPGLRVFIDPPKAGAPTLDAVSGIDGESPNSGSEGLTPNEVGTSDADDESTIASQSPFGAPGHRITAEFGTYEGGTLHNGVDIVPAGSSYDIHPIGPGKVYQATQQVKKEWNEEEGKWVVVKDAAGNPELVGYGNYVVVEHKRDDGVTYYSRYAHLESKPELEVGQTVDENTVLGQMGASGTAYGAHLHLELYNCEAESKYYLKHKPHEIYDEEKGTTWEDKMLEGYLNPIPIIEGDEDWEWDTEWLQEADD